MPFYFSNPKSIPTRKKRGGRTGIDGRIRTAPSAVFMFTSQVIMHLSYSLALANLHLLYALFVALGDGKNSVIHPNTKRVSINFLLTGGFGLRIPSIFTGLYKQGLRDDIVDQIVSRGMLEFTFGPPDQKAYYKDRPSLSDIAYLSTLDDHFSDLDAPKRYISVENMSAYSILVGRIFQVHASLANLNGDFGGKLMVSSNAVGPEIKVTRYDSGGSTVVTQNSDIYGTGSPAEYSAKKVDYGTHTSLGFTLPDNYTIVTDHNGSVTQAIAKAADFEKGIFVPWQIDFSAPDDTIIFRFLSLFMRFFTQSEADEVITAWRDEISSTEEGQWFAHIMMGLILAHDGGFSPYVIKTAAGTYDGLILFGTNGITSASSGYYPALPRDELIQELREFNFHDSVLTKLVTQNGLTVPTGGFVSMRQLKAQLMPGNILPSGDIINRNNKWLKYLSFPQDPLPGNVSDFQRIAPLLVDDNLPIPEDLYLYWEDVYTNDRLRLILSAFGDNIPDFNLGATKNHKIAATTSPRIAREITEPYNPAGPIMLQSKKQPMKTALVHWRSMLENGATPLKTDFKVANSRTYSGRDKTAVWRFFNEVCSVTVGARNAAQTAGNSAGEDRGQRRRREEDGPDAEEEKRKKKRARAVMFGAPDDS